MEYNIIYLSGGRQKSYLTAARRVIWRPPEELFDGRQKSYLAAARRVIWPAARRDRLSGGCQITLLVAAAR